jgi:hypothetical protein
MLYAVERQVLDGHRICVILHGDGPLKAELEERGAKVEVSPFDPVFRRAKLASPWRFLRFVIDVAKSFFLYRRIAKSFSADLLDSNTSVTMVDGLVARSLNIPPYA